MKMTEADPRNAASVFEQRQATEPEVNTGTGRHPLTPGPTRDPTHPGSRACRFVPDLPFVHLAPRQVER
jgi:hypothetical protein